MKRVTDPMSNYQDELEYLLDYAREDWVGLTPIEGASVELAPSGASLDESLAAMIKVIGDLIDQGAVPGDLTAGDPGFEAWPGTKQERLDRISSEIRKLGRIPVSGEICWIHVPSSTE